MNSPQDFIKQLQLEPHPEGGFFRQTYRSQEAIPAEGLPGRFKGNRFISTAIYYLLPSGAFSVFHRIKSDELWHFYYGSPLKIYVMDEQGVLVIIRLGNNPGRDEQFQAMVAHGKWFAAEPDHPGSFTLVGCTVAPGFDFEDFEMADKSEMIRLFPQHRDIVSRLCR